MDDAMLNIVSAVIAELRDDDDIAAIVGTRIRHNSPLGEVHDTVGTLTYDGDSLDAGRYKSYIVLTVLSDPPLRRVPVQFAEIAIKCYAPTQQQARVLYGTVVKAMHDVGVRVKTNGLGIYRSAMIGGGSDDYDPRTGQPLVIGDIQLIATTVAVT